MIWNKNHAACGTHSLFPHKMIINQKFSWNLTRKGFWLGKKRANENQKLDKWMFVNDPNLTTVNQR